MPGIAIRNWFARFKLLAPMTRFYSGWAAFAAPGPGSRPRPARASGGGGAHVARDQRQQFVLGVGLAEVVVDAELGSVVAVLLRDARGDHDHWQRAQPGVRPHQIGRASCRERV